MEQNMACRSSGAQPVSDKTSKAVVVPAETTDTLLGLHVQNKAVTHGTTGDLGHQRC